MTPDEQIAEWRARGLAVTVTEAAPVVFPPATRPAEAQPAAARRTRAPKLVAPGCVWAVTLTVPLVTVSAANLREHHMVRAKRVKRERAAVALAFMNANWPHPPAFMNVHVTLTRLGGKDLDGDNLQSAMKPTRDEVAAWLRLDDADPRVTWAYDQKAGGLRGVRVTIEGADHAAG